MQTSRRTFLALAPLALAGCAKSFTPDASTVDFVQTATILARQACGLLPTADTLAKVVLALALPAGLGPEAVASQVAHAICDQAAPQIKGRMGRRGIEPSTGRTTIDYGPVIINGRPVPLVVYA